MPSVLYNAIQLKNGAKVKRPAGGPLTQPVQMLLRAEKDAEWCAWNLDWLERLGLLQLRRNARRLLKNYRLAAGIIDRADYIPGTENEQTELLDVLTQEDAGAFELKFFPIIPNVVNVLQGEFQKRTDKITYAATDQVSYNERLDEKHRQVEQVLLAAAEQKVMRQLQQSGQDPQGEEAQAALAPEQLRTLPEIEQFMQKSWKSQYEQWAQHQHKADEGRFNLRELESEAFRDMLVADREFWAFELGEDDYRVSLLNPVFTFYHKSPNVRYISEGNHVGWFELMSVSDVIDTLGWRMDETQLESLQLLHGLGGAHYLDPGKDNDGSFYNPSQSHEWNTSPHAPSLGMRQLLSSDYGLRIQGDDVFAQIMNEHEDLLDGRRDLLRVTTAYWKSQLRVGHLTMVDEETGTTTDLIVDESFRLTSRPVYDNSVLKGKNRQTLLAGQHVDWMWINQTWGGKKITRNGIGYATGWGGSKDSPQFSPLYLGVEPLPFQFKGDDSLYGCKLPVEGRVFSDRNTRSHGLVDQLKPFQVGYNMVNNQIADILIDELGTVVILDQNALPKHSLGEDRGSDPMQMAYSAMKGFQILPIDSSMQNTEQPLSFQHYQSLDLSQTQRLLSRVQLAEYFKRSAFESIGLTPERLGAVGQQQSGTSIEQATNLSYTQTEVYFTQHSEHLMPRVHQMRTDLAQHYHATKPGVRLQYQTSQDEQINFEVNGTDLLGRDIGVFCSTSVNIRETMEKIRALALSNTTGSSIFDLSSIVQAGSLAELNGALKAGQQRQEAAQAQEQDSQSKLQQQLDEAAAARQTELLAHEDQLQARELQNNIDVANIKGLGFQTPDDNADYLSGIQLLEKGRLADADRELKRQALTNQQLGKQADQQLKREDLQTRRDISKDALQVARVNRNKFDLPRPPAAKKK